MNKLEKVGLSSPQLYYEVCMSKRRLYRGPKVVKFSVRRLPLRPFGGLLGPAKADARQSLLALSFAASTSLITGLAIAGLTDVFQQNPGLLLLIPAAIGLRGNVFGPFGSRLSTAIRAGTFSWSKKPDSVLGQNIIVAFAISFIASIGMAVLAALVANISQSGRVIGLDDFIVVSVCAAMLASLAVLAITLGLAVVSARLGWDLDNVTAPIVSASGDFVTLPALLVGILLIDQGWVTVALAGVFSLGAIACLVFILRSKLKIASRICKESIPVILAAATLSLVAGVVLERSLDRLNTFPVMLVILPGYAACAGALGGILSNRLATKVHLGLISPTPLPQGDAVQDIKRTFKLALPIFFLLAVLGNLIGSAANKATPGIAQVVLVAVSGGLVATAFVAFVAYYGTLFVVKFRLDPDNHGIPIVSASLDIVAASTLIGALSIWHIV